MFRIAVAAAMSAAAIQPAVAQNLPTAEGSCTRTTIQVISTRLDRTPGSGPMVTFAGGDFVVGYANDPAINASKPGDPVMVCLVSLDKDCPKGVRPTGLYTTTNLRTGKSWTLGDRSHSC